MKLKLAIITILVLSVGFVYAQGKEIKQQEQNSIELYRYDSSEDFRREFHSIVWSEVQLAKVSKNYPVTNRVEEIYDRNQSKELEPYEVLFFLRDAYESALKKKRIHIVSNVISPYDFNQNGFLERREAKAIEIFLYE